LFLVKTDKMRSENPDFNLQGLILKDVREKTNFAFSPFTIETPAGSLNVQIGGSLQGVIEGKEPQLVFTTTRTIRTQTQFSTSGSSRAASTTSSGFSTTRNPMPGPGEVLSFELPPIRVPNSTATVLDQYSVRVRIR